MINNIFVSYYNIQFLNKETFYATICKEVFPTSKDVITHHNFGYHIKTSGRCLYLEYNSWIGIIMWEMLVMTMFNR